VDFKLASTGSWTVSARRAGRSRRPSFRSPQSSASG